MRNPEAFALAGPLEKAFLLLSRRWEEGFRRLDPMEGTSRELDLSALSALLLVVELPEALGETARAQAQTCADLAEKRFFGWLDWIPWRITLDLLAGEGRNGPGMLETMEHLNEPNSARRYWTLEVAWIARSLLDREKALPRLFANVAECLSGVEESWGLAGALSDNPTLLQWAAEAWEPDSWEEQYRSRVAQLLEMKLDRAQAALWRREAQCRKAILVAMAPR